jgi:hypothetical protein
LFMSYVKVHTALFNEPSFGPVSFPSNVAELDWSVGRILAVLKETGADANTLVWFTSDNGPYLERGVEGGSTGYVPHPTEAETRMWLRGGKGQNWEGGIRVPGIVWFPNTFAQGGVVHHSVSTMDIFPTTLAVVDRALNRTTDGNGGGGGGAGCTPLPELDGIDLSPLLLPTAAETTAGTSGATGVTGETGETGAERRVGGKKPNDEERFANRFLVHYCGFEVHAARRGRYKMHFETARWDDEAVQACPAKAVCGCTGNAVHTHTPPLLFDLHLDAGESAAIDPESEEYRVQTALIRAELAAHRERVGRPAVSQLETLARPWLFPCCNFPQCECDKESVGSGGEGPGGEGV